MRNPGIGSLVMVMALVAASCSEGSDDPSAAELSTTSPQVETTVPADPVPETSDAPEPEPVAATEPAPDVTGPAPETTEPAPEAPELPEGYEGHVSEVYVDEANWVCLPGKADPQPGRPSRRAVSGVCPGVPPAHTDRPAGPGRI